MNQFVENTDLASSTDALSDSTVLEVVDSPSLLDDTPLKKALDEADQDYTIPVKPPAPHIQISKPNIRYVECFYTEKEQRQCLKELFLYNYESVSFDVHGRTFTPKRRMSAFGDSEVNYSFSGLTLKSKSWTFMMKSIKDKVEAETGYQFNHALLNFYPDGAAKLSQHKDNEDGVDTSVPVVTLSFGSERSIQFTKKGETAIIQPLRPGSLLIIYNQQWNYGVLPDFNTEDPTISISFRKLLVPDTVQPPQSQTSSPISTQAYLKFANMGPAQDMGDPGFLNSFPHAYAQPVHETSGYLDSFPDAQHLTPCEPPVKRRCPDTEELDIPDNDWLTSHYQKVAQIKDFPSYEFSDIKKFWLSDAVAVGVQTYEGELCVQIREYESGPWDNWFPTRKGVGMDMFTFYELCQKVPTLSKSLNHSSESCILNNCLMMNIVDQRMHLRQFSEMGMHPHEIVLTPEMFQCLCKRLYSIIDFLLEYQFDTLLRSKVSLYTGPHPTTDSAFCELKKIIKNNMQEGIRFAFICPDCVIGRPSMFFHKCRRLSYSEKLMELPYYTPLLVKVSDVARDYLVYNEKLNFENYRFCRLFKEMH